MFRRRIVLACALLALVFTSRLQADLTPEAGQFPLQTYLAKNYAALPQNWAITQDRRGVLYFGNTDGTLEFDGVTWRHIPLDNRSGARALAVDAHGTVYAGGQGTFGYLRPDATGNMQFVSLLDRLPKSDRQFGDIWQVLATPEGVYFSSYHYVFLVAETGAIQVWRSEAMLGRVLFRAFGRVYLSSAKHGVMTFEQGRLVPCAWGSRFIDDPLVAAYASPRGALLASTQHIFRFRSNGLQPFPTSADAGFVDQQIYAISELASGDIAVGTTRGGLVLLNSQGEVSRSITKSNGLPSNFVTSLFADREANLWIATDGGIAQCQPGLTRFSDAQGLRGSVYAIGRLNGAIYAGTTAGLYRMRVSEGKAPTFEPVDPITETVWVIANQGDLSLVGTQHALYSISHDQAHEIFAGNLIYHIAFSPRDPNIVYTAGRDGVRVLRRNGEKLNIIAEEKGSGQDFRTVAEDNDGRLWATTRVDIWRIDLRDQLQSAAAKPANIERFEKADGVPSGWKNVYRFHGHVVFATEKGLLRFSESERRFVPDDELGAQFADGKKPVSLLEEDAHHDVWVTGDGYHGVLRQDGTKAQAWVPMPLLGSGIEETWALHLDADGTAWASGAEGPLFRWSPRSSGDPNKGFEVLIRRVNLSNQESTVYGGGGELKEAPKVLYRQNALRFEYAAPFYQDEAGVQYQVRLEGSDHEWSPWSLETRKDYTNLPPHELRFCVRARNPHGVVTREATFNFRVLPPWYRTWWAYTLLLVAFLLTGRLIVQWRLGVLRAQNRRLERIVEERTVEVRTQRDQNEALLLNILPAPVAAELRDNGAVTPMAFDDVTVCFTDFVGFTLSSEHLPADELVSALNEYFTAFDRIMDRYGLEKLKTIGDSYMFVSGLPTPRQSHAVDAVLAALEMVEVVKQLSRPEEGVNWKIRIGLYSGPVVAGVVGKRKFAFDIWGNTVNFASRMESSGAANRVNLSATTCGRVQELIACEPRGRVRIKEGRELEMQFALGVKPELLSGSAVNGIPAAFRTRYEEVFHESPKAFPEFLLVPEEVLNEQV